jgi:hypothetical protein
MYEIDYQYRYSYELIILLIVLFTVIAYVLSMILVNSSLVTDISSSAGLAGIVAASVVGREGDGVVDSVEGGNIEKPKEQEQEQEQDQDQKPKDQEPKHELVSGGSLDKLDAKQTKHYIDEIKKMFESTFSKTKNLHYDEYDDDSLYLTKDKSVSNIKSIVIDGNNIIHYLGNKYGSTYLHNFRRSIISVSKLFPKKEIFFVLKDPPHIRLKENIILSIKTSMSSTQEDAEQIYVQLFSKFITSQIAAFPKVRVVMAYGSSKSRDDFTAIYMSSVLPNSIILTRDRYSDIVDISIDNNNLNYYVYGKSTAKYEKMLNKKQFKTIGRWDITNKLVGISITKTMTPAIYNKQVNEKSLAGSKVLLLLSSLKKEIPE